MRKSSSTNQIRPNKARRKIVPQDTLREMIKMSDKKERRVKGEK
jgi:hypothetical protein